MATLGYCNIDNLKLSVGSKRAISDVKEIMEQGNLFTAAVGAIPLFQIFASPSLTGRVTETAITIREYDWEAFSNILNSTRPIIKNQIFKIAYKQEIFTYGKEAEFWRCVSEASK